MQSLLYKDSYFVDKKKTNYFEGYYTRLVSDIINVAIIFGVSKSQDNHAFIQVYDGEKKVMEYFRFPLESFTAKKDHFYVAVGNNVLQESGMHIELAGNEINLYIDITFGQLRTMNETKYRSIMGPIRHLPFLECIHGVVSMWHTFSGNINNSLISGHSYIEKDYGTSMPKRWIWVHGINHEGVSFMCSLATVPYLGLQPEGCLGFFSTHDKTDIFASYTHAKIYVDHLSNEKLSLTIKTKEYDYIINLTRANTVHLKAPVFGKMELEIEESLESHGTLIKFNKITKEKVFIQLENIACEVVGYEYGNNTLQ